MDAAEMGDSFEFYWETRRFLEAEEIFGRSVPEGMLIEGHCCCSMTID
jgi:hypothetical protein